MVLLMINTFVIKFVGIILCSIDALDRCIINVHFRQHSHVLFFLPHTHVVLFLLSWGTGQNTSNRVQALHYISFVPLK